MKHLSLLIFATLFFSQSIMAQWETQWNTFRRRPCGTAMMMQQNTAETRAIATAPNYVKHTGSVTIPVILVNFSDVKFTINNPKEAFEQFFNGEKYDTLQTDYGNGNRFNHGSVATYFKDMSDSTFLPKFKVYGPVTVSHPETYYGGTDENSNSDEKPRQLVIDALALIKDSVSTADLQSFSVDGSTIESVYILYAGIDQNDNGPATAVWANTSTSGATLAEKTGKTTKTVRWYTMSGELMPYKLNSSGEFAQDGTIPAITGIGVACHEFSHAMGLPDLYPFSDTSARVDNQEMEYWDLMDAGEYAGNGYYPTAYTAFEKEQMGWPVTIKTLSSDASITMTNSTEKGGTAYEIVNPSNSLEYFMLECIQRRGWNKHQYGNGLLVYHVNLPSSTVSLTTDLNDKKGYPCMAVVPADGACLSSYIAVNKPYYAVSLRGDLFPGSGNNNPDTLNVSVLNDVNSKPNFCWYNTDFWTNTSSTKQKLTTNKALKNITYNTSMGVVTFDYINDFAAGILPVWNKETKDSRIYSVDGRYLGTDLNALPHDVYIVDGRKIVK
jgi:immune inhibitor A